jgi:formylglycine-generating enzyme required for sulfatase activity
VQGAEPAPLSDVVLVAEPIIITPTPPAEVDVSNMVLVPEGEFIMGAPDEWIEENQNGRQREIPQHKVYLDAYYIDKYEVTNEDYAAFLNAWGQNMMGCNGQTCVGSVVIGDDGNTVSSTSFWLREYVGRQNTYQAEQGYERHPAINVSWYGAQTYCAWQGKRLPTEAEWEKAARGTDGRRYPWGDEWNEESLAGMRSRDRREIGLAPLNVSPYGVYDMSGNAGEWVNDWFTVDYYVASPYRNPQGPTDPSEHRMRKVIRSPAGSIVEWGITIRKADNPSSITLVGFRCAYSEEK